MILDPLEKQVMHVKARMRALSSNEIRFALMLDSIIYISDGETTNSLHGRSHASNGVKWQ